MGESIKSKYKPSFPKKYKGNADNIICRSSWERIIKVKENTGHIKTYVVEVKPKRQTQPPKKKSRVTKSYLYECKTYAVNQAKWKAAVEFCEDRRINFKVVTEDELGIK